MSSAPADTGGALRDYADLPGPRPLPWIGNLLQLDRESFHRSIEDGVSRYGPTWRLRLGRQKVMVITDRAAMMALLRDRPLNWQRGSRLTTVLNALGPRGVFSAEGEQWRRQRRLVTRGLNPEVIGRFHPQLAQMCARLVERWRRQLAGGEAPDLFRDLKALTLDVTVALAMGEHVDTLDHPGNPLPMDIHRVFLRIGDRLRSPLPNWKLLRRAKDREADAAWTRVLEAVDGFVARARRDLQADAALRERPANLMQAFVAARDEPDSGIGDREVIGNALTMVFAGEDTTSSTLSWAVHLVAGHPDVARRVGEEVDAVLGPARVPADPATLERLEYTEAVVHETLRLKPAAPMLGAQSSQERVVCGVRVPAGVLVMMPIRIVALRPEVFADPHAFRPERWLGRLDVASDVQRQMLPFGAGPRLCPGRYFALVEAKTALAAIVRNFRVSRLADAAPVRERFSFTMTPSHVPVRLEPR